MDNFGTRTAAVQRISRRGAYSISEFLVTATNSHGLGALPNFARQFIDILTEGLETVEGRLRGAAGKKAGMD